MRRYMEASKRPWEWPWITLEGIDFSYSDSPLAERVRYQSFRGPTRARIAERHWS